MEARDGRTDARTAMMRCYEALAGCSDIETKRSLWRAAQRYSGRMRAEPASRLEINDTGSRVHQEALGESVPVLGRVEG